MPLRRTLLIAVALALLVAACAVGAYVYRRVRDRVVPTAVGWRARVSTFAGDGSPGARDEQAAARARFADPFGVAVDAAGNVYVADGGASNRVRKVTPQGAVSTLAGGAEGYADGVGAGASFNTPSGLAIDARGNLYVADTGNNRIRKVTPDGAVSTLAGDGRAGYADGPAASARFDAPLGVAVDKAGNVYVADTYNDRVRVVTRDGSVRTLAGGAAPGYTDGPAAIALFDTPAGVAVASDGSVIVADTGNDRLRKVTPDGQVSTLNFAAEGLTEPALDSPVGLALTRDNFIYATEQGRGRVWQIAPDGRAHLIAGAGRGFADGDGRTEARFNQPAGLALDAAGALYIADAANYLVRKIAPADPTAGADVASGTAAAASTEQVLPRLDANDLGIARLPWPLEPQDAWHEVTATMGEARGSYDTKDSRHHLHSGVDVFGGYGATVRAIFGEKVASPICNWGFGELNEGTRVGLFAYVHLTVGRDAKGQMLDDARFVAVKDASGKLARVRVRRGARFKVGDALGAVNRMYHVHLNFGPPGAEMNPLALPLANFSDGVAPQITRGGIQLFDAGGRQLEQKRGARLVVPRGPLRVVVDAFDQVDGNAARRRLGVYRLAFQLLKSDGAPAPGFESPRVQIEFDRLPPAQAATKIAYADESGITVYGSEATRFLYELTNYVRAGRAEPARWDASALPAGDYTLRVFAADFAGNVAEANRDIEITIE